MAESESFWGGAYDFISGALDTAIKGGQAYNEFKGYDEQQQEQIVVLQKPLTMADSTKWGLNDPSNTSNPVSAPAAQLVAGVDNKLLLIGVGGILMFIVGMKL